MYSLKITRLKTSLYDAVPLLCFCWGLVLACHVGLSPQFYLELSLVFAIFVSILMLIKRCIHSNQGELSIIANQAFLDTKQGRYLVQFERFNSWRLLAHLTLESPTNPIPNTWHGYLALSYLSKKLKQALFEPSYLSVYHSMIKQDTYAYLRSFAAYQCHMSKVKTP